jgi:hypothetical protein
VAIKVNLLPREAAAARRARPGPAITMPKLAVGAGLVAQVMTGILVLVVVGLAVMWYMASSSRGSYAREITQLKARNEALKSQLVGYAILIRGRAFSNLQIADFMENLRKAGVFSDVDFVVTQAERVEQTRVMAFEVTANVKL